jgi:hypothetical protein
VKLNKHRRGTCAYSVVLAAKRRPGVIMIAEALPVKVTTNLLHRPVSGSPQAASLTPQSSDSKAKASPLHWSEVPPQILPERAQAAADIRAILDDPEMEYGTLVRVTGRAMYVFGGMELKRILLGLVKLLEEAEQQPTKEQPASKHPPHQKEKPPQPPVCRHCKSNAPVRLRSQECSDGRFHIRADCGACGKWLRFIPQTPKVMNELASRSTRQPEPDGVDRL